MKTILMIWRSILKLSNIQVSLVDKMGSDLSVVNAARVSFDKSSDWQIDYNGKVLNDADRKLVSYLATHNHWSPFSHAFASFRIKAPIFVARQLVKHTVGLAWNEVSRRYVSSEPEFYLPDYWRKSATNVKQGSSEESIRGSDNYMEAAERYVRELNSLYNGMIQGGICAEQARMMLPQNTMTEWIWSGSLYAFARVCNLRLDSHTQKETQEIAKQISDYMIELFPESWNVLVTK